VNTALYERLGVRNSAGAFAGLLVSGLGSSVLVLGGWAILLVGRPDPTTVFTAMGRGAVVTGASMGSALDGIAGIIITVLLGFYVAIIGGQVAVGFDVAALRSKLSYAAQVLAVLFCCTAVFRAASLAVDGLVGGILITALETAIIVGLAIELTSWVLLGRQQQLEQNQRALERSRERIAQAAALLSRPFRKRPVLVTLLAIACTSLAPVLLAVMTPGARVGFAPFVFLLVAITHGAFFLVHWARVSHGLRGLRWFLFLVPAIFGLVVALAALQLIATGLVWAGAAVGASFLVVAVANLPVVRGPGGISFSLREVAVRLELLDAVDSRRRAQRHLRSLRCSVEPFDEGALLAWLRRPGGGD